MRKNKDGFMYERLPVDLMLERLKKFEKSLKDFQTMFPDLGEIRYSIPLLYEIFERVDKRADYYLFFHSKPEKPMELSQAKEIALMVFWILKYKPLSQLVYEANELFQRRDCTVNELFAVYIIMTYVIVQSKRKDIKEYFSQDNIDRLVYNFMHRDFSKEALILYLSALLDIVED